MRSSSFAIVLQAVIAMLLGILTGLLILGFTQKREAHASGKSTLPLCANSGTIGPLQVLPMLSERMTVLVMGVDSNGRNTERFTGTRSDTMVLVSLDPQAHKVGMVSIPRDSRVAIAEDHGTDKINSAHAFGGPQLSVKTVSEDFGVPVDHYLVVDTQALKDLCQLLGPVEVNVEKEMKYHDWSAHLHVDLKPGLQTLQPEQVEQYVRFRHDARGDIGRIERQQWFFRAAAKKMQDPQFLLRLPDLVRMAHEYVRTDLSLEDMAKIATFAKDVKQQDVVTATVPGLPQMINGGSYWVPDMEASRIVFDRILGYKQGGAFTADDANTGGVDAQGQLVAQKPITVAIKYSKGAEMNANFLEKVLNDAGYRVRYKWLMPTCECQHEQIVQMSARANDEATSLMRQRVHGLADFPPVMQLESKPVVDFTVVVSPETQLPGAQQFATHVSQNTVVAN